MIRSHFQPSYIELFETGELENRVGEALKMLTNCRVCPRECGVDRQERVGVCRTGRLAKVSSFNAHFGEEPPISGIQGSGTIFFTNCNLRCIYCQNYPISQLGHGEEVSPEELASMMLTLQRWGCHNVNFVTPSHVVPQILESLWLAVKKGFSLPLVYNSSGYDSLSSLRLLDGVIDIYMPDLRYADNKAGKMFSGVEDYVEVSRTAVREMHRQVGDLQLDEKGIAKRGLLIRHLVLPRGWAGTKSTMEFIAREISPRTYISLMSQYFPAYKATENPEINRRITPSEYEEAKRAMLESGLENGWFQDI
ncbi:MAG: radical SAM protein [Caldiserica bacterium]|jgi:putative pyruvate formate lyase activating enzyme|nr:radical SAM protein [Caldisericota bacterium]MDH7562852.1 radical SAM protein [Caldisericota bacterium]